MRLVAGDPGTMYEDEKKRKEAEAAAFRAEVLAKAKPMKGRAHSGYKPHHAHRHKKFVSPVSLGKLIRVFFVLFLFILFVVFFSFWIMKAYSKMSHFSNLSIQTKSSLQLFFCLRQRRQRLPRRSTLPSTTRKRKVANSSLGRNI